MVNVANYALGNPWRVFVTTTVTGVIPKSVCFNLACNSR
jgi:hypothetical protein